MTVSINCSVKAKFHYAIMLANQLASWFASTSQHFCDLLTSWSQTC